LAGGLCKFYANARGKATNTAQTTLDAIQASSQSTFINDQLYNTCDEQNDKNAANIFKPMQTGINRNEETFPS
jgi:hypothetical protein